MYTHQIFVETASDHCIKHMYARWSHIQRLYLTYKPTDPMGNAVFRATVTYPEPTLIPPVRAKGI
jgi:hypothetical protein